MAEKRKNAESNIKTDSFVYRLCFSIGKWFLVSLLFWFCSIPVITAGTSYSAALAVSHEDIADLRDIFSRFFSCFSTFFKRTVPVFLLLCLFILLQILNLSFYNQFFTKGTVVYYIAAGVILLLTFTAVSVFRFYAFETTNNEPLTIKKCFVGSIHRMLKCLPVTGILALMDIVLAVTIAGAPIVFPVLFIYPGFQTFLTCILIQWFDNSGNKYKKHSQ